MGVRGYNPAGRDQIGTWTHDKCKDPGERTGWLAGDVHVFTCHSSRASKPCRKHYLGATATCVGCEMGIEIKDLGFVPIWRHDGKPTLVIVQEHSFELVGRLKLHQSIQWGRAAGIGEGVWVKPALASRPWVTTLPQKQVAVDVVRGCCVLFGMLDMENVLRESLQKNSDNALSPAAPLTPRELAREVDQVKREAGEKIVGAVRRSFVVKDNPEVPISELMPNYARNGVHRKT